MGLLVTNNRDVEPHLNALDGGGGVNRGVQQGSNPNSPCAIYLDRDDRMIGHTLGDTPPASTSTIWDPNLIDAVSGRVGDFLSPLAGGDQDNFPYFVSDFEPATNDQRLFQSTNGAVTFQELLYNDPTQIVTTDAFPECHRSLSANIPFGDPLFYANESPGNGSWIFFPDIDLGIMLVGRVYLDDGGPTLKQQIAISVKLSTGEGTPLGVPAQYTAGANEFNRGPIFGEPVVTFNHLQFIADDISTHAKPRGELFMWSQPTNPSGNIGRIYVKFVDFNPSAVDGLPNRIHLRETLLSRVVIDLNTVPAGDPPVPLNGWVSGALSNQGNMAGWFSTFGSRRINFIHSTNKDRCFMLQVSKAAIPAFISVPSPKLTPATNRLVTYQSEVTGDLDEDIANAVVSWSITRGSTVSEILATTPTPGETVTVDNPPIDQVTAFGAGFAVLEDDVELDDPTEYTVSDPVAGEITFVGPKPLAGGEVYTARYAHPDTPATPAHGAVIDSSVFTTILGIAQTRISYPDDDDLAGHIDLVRADTPT